MKGKREKVNTAYAGTRPNPKQGGMLPALVHSIGDATRGSNNTEGDAGSPVNRA